MEISSGVKPAVRQFWSECRLEFDPRGGKALFSAEIWHHQSPASQKVENKPVSKVVRLWQRAKYLDFSSLRKLGLSARKRMVHLADGNAAEPLGFSIKRFGGDIAHYDMQGQLTHVSSSLDWGNTTVHRDVKTNQVIGHTTLSGNDYIHESRNERPLPIPCRAAGPYKREIELPQNATT